MDQLSREELGNRREQVAMLIRPSVLDYLDKIEGIDGADVVWSQWEGYLKDETARMAAFHDFIQKRGINLHTIHTSGHASIGTMNKLVSALQPKLIIPIHTDHPERFSEVLPDVQVAVMNDGIPIAL